MKSTLIILFCLTFLLCTGLAQTGSFSGNFVFEWVNQQNGPDREMIVQNPVSFTDPAGKEWPVPKGAQINGASIPPLFYQLIGPPFVGDYRRASVIHDHYCDIKTEDWKSTHRMFRDACIAGGVSDGKARTMYLAVYAGGPRWKMVKKAVDRNISPNGTLEVLDVRIPDIPEAELEELSQWVEESDVSYTEIEARVDAAIQNPFPIPPGTILK